MSKDIKEILKEATKDLLTPESLTAIEQAVNEKAEEKTKLQVEAALVAQDDKHSQMLSSLMEKMDIDYTTKLQKLVTRLDESYAAKLLNVKKVYDGRIGQLNEQIKTTAKNYIKDLSGKIDTFVESRINDLLPADRLNEAVENVKAVHILEQIRNLVGIDESTIRTDIKAAMVDGKKQITESKQQLDQIITENAQLKSKLQKKEVEVLLEQKTAKLPAKKRQHVKRVLADKDVAFINENLEYVCDMFDRSEVIEAKNAKSEVKPLSDNVDTPQQVINESSNNSSDDVSVVPFMSDYLSGLK